MSIPHGSIIRSPITKRYGLVCEKPANSSVSGKDYTWAYWSYDENPTVHSDGPFWVPSSTCEVIKSNVYDPVKDFDIS